MHGRWHRAIFLLSAGAAVGLFGSCRGPAALDAAIRPADEAAYFALASHADPSLREAFYQHQAESKGMTVEQARRADAAVSATRNPFHAGRDAAAVSRGAVIYRNQCARCHGFAAEGIGPDLPIYRPAMDFRRFGRRFSVTLHGGAPKKWFKVIADGVTVPAEDNESGMPLEMPAFGDVLAREQIWLVVTYLQSADKG
jgi:mono/diheme cytochrome c family protein